MDVDSDDFTAYASTRWGALYRRALLLTGNATQADDLAQATLVKTYVQWGKVRKAVSADAYVRQIMLNELLDEKRRDERRAAKSHLVVVSDEISANEEQSVDLWAALATLPPRQRAVIVLRYYEDLTEAETAEILGVSRGTVKSQAHDALRTLRTRLPDYDIQSDQGVS